MRLHAGMEIELDWETLDMRHYEALDSDPRLLGGGSFCYKLYCQLEDGRRWHLHSESLLLEPVLQARVLYDVRPNPFNPHTTISFMLAEEGPVCVTVHDIAGRCVRSLFSGALSRDTPQLSWDGRDETGRAAPTGLYFIRVRAGAETATGRVAIVR